MLKFFEHFSKNKQQDDLLNQVSQGIEESDLVSIINDRKVVYRKIDEITYIANDGKYTDVFFTNGEKITSSVVMLEFYDKLLDQGFVKMDRTTYVHFNNIVWYDLDYYRVYFNDIDYIQVAGAVLRKFKVALGKERDIRNAPSFNAKEFRPIVL